MGKSIQVNRAPVMTLWAAVVAERLGYDPQEALTLGQAVSGLNAQSKGQRLGIYDKSNEEEIRAARNKQPEEQFAVGLLGRAVPVVNTPEGLRAVNKGRTEDPQSVQRYLEKKFGDALPAVQQAMQDLAGSYSPEDLKRQANSLYQVFRPEIPEGKRGWGAEGALDLDKIRSAGGER